MPTCRHQQNSSDCATDMIRQFARQAESRGQAQNSAKPTTALAFYFRYKARDVNNPAPAALFIRRPIWSGGNRDAGVSQSEAGWACTKLQSGLFACNAEAEASNQ